MLLTCERFGTRSGAFEEHLGRFVIFLSGHDGRETKTMKSRHNTSKDCLTPTRNRHVSIGRAQYSLFIPTNPCKGLNMCSSSRSNGVEGLPWCRMSAKGVKGAEGLPQGQRGSSWADPMDPKGGFWSSKAHPMRPKAPPRGKTEQSKTIKCRFLICFMPTRPITTHKTTPNDPNNIPKTPPKRTKLKPKPHQ